MKSLLLVVLLAGVSLADQGSDSFVTGFAQALQQAIAAQQGQTPQPVTIPNTQEQGHYDTRDNSGRMGGYTFATLSQCERYANNNGVFDRCEWVEK